MTSLYPKILDHDFTTPFQGATKYTCVICGGEREDHVPLCLQRIAHHIEQMLVEEYAQLPHRKLNPNWLGRYVWTVRGREFSIIWNYQCKCVQLDSWKGQTMRC